MEPPHVNLGRLWAVACVGYECWEKGQKSSVAGNRTRVSWVKARYPNRWTTTDDWECFAINLIYYKNKCKDHVKNH